MQSSWLLQHYNAAVRKYPLRTQAVTTGALWWLGDALSQRLEQQRRPGRYDTRRAFLSTAFGAVAVGPLGHFFYNGLDRAAGALLRRGSLEFVAFKVLADSVIYEPLYVLGSFALMTLGRGGSWADLCHKVRHDFWLTLGTELLVWPAIQAANFKLVPSPDLQVLVVNLISCLDSAFISHIAVQPAGFKLPLPSKRQRQAGLCASTETMAIKALVPGGSTLSG